MNNQIIFKQTGNFWIDNGLVALRRTLLDLKDELSELGQEYEAEFTDAGLLVTVVEGDMKTVLNMAKDALGNHYLNTSNDKYRWYYNETTKEFVLFPKKSYKLHINTFFNAKPAPPEKGELFTPATQLSSKDVATGRKRLMTNSEYDFFQQFRSGEKNVEIFKKMAPSSDKEGGFIDESNKYHLGIHYDEGYSIHGKNKCQISGLEFKEVLEVNGMYYPFLTSGSGELNFSSLLSAKPKIAKKYAFVSLFAPLQLHYLIKQFDKDKFIKHYFALYDADLQSLSYFYTAIQTDITQLKNSTYCNFKTEIVGTEYEAEGLMNFLISVYEQLKDELKYDDLLTKSIFTFSNDGNIFRDVKQYTSLATLFRLFESYREEGLLPYYFNFIRYFYRQFKKNGRDEYDTLFRDKLCRDILFFRSINKTIETYFSEVKMKDGKSVSFLDKLILMVHP